MGKPSNRGYKRSWRNYLLDARYQLRFTLFMVLLSGLLMTGLGVWVMQAADKATGIALDNVRGIDCQDPMAMEAAAAAPEVQEVVVEDEMEELPAVEGAPPEPPADEAVAEPPRERARPVVTVDVQTEDVQPVVGPSVVRYHMCRLRKASTIEKLELGKTRILLVMIAAGILVSLGLALKGIVMTHKVAGPLHKVSLYFAKMEAGTFDTVYNLRKGDQLVAFYDHFKEAHAGLKKAEDADYQMMRELLAALEAAGAADTSPEIAAAVADLREKIAAKDAAS